MTGLKENAEVDRLSRFLAGKYVCAVLLDVYAVII